MGYEQNKFKGFSDKIIKAINNNYTEIFYLFINATLIYISRSEQDEKSKHYNVF